MSVARVVVNSVQLRRQTVPGIVIECLFVHFFTNEGKSVVVRPIEELRYLILAGQREGSRLLMNSLRLLNLTPSQAEVLRVLQEHQPLSLFALGELLICEQGSPSRLVSGLVRAGYIKRSQSTANGRMITLELTECGQQMADQVRAAEEQYYQELETILEGVPLSELLTALRHIVRDRPTGKALAKRSGHTDLKLLQE